jgi:hypothetical protein
MPDDLEGLRRKLAILLPHLDERQRRLVMGAEARALGHGGIKKVATAAQVSAVTVSRGIADLEADDQPLHRTRRPGGGRKKLLVTDPGLRAALLDVLEAQSPGPAPAPLRWTTKSLRGIAAELAHRGHLMSAPTVASLLRQEHFSLYASARQVDGWQRADREAQFRYINDQAVAHMAAGQPVISVEARKTELVGRPDDAERQLGAVADPGLASADPMGGQFGMPTSDDSRPGTGWSVVAGDADTAAFAVAAIRSWWARVGRVARPAAEGLMICPNGSDLNDSCSGAWQAELVRLADETGLRIMCCHLPPGTSKWHEFEHRFFSCVSTSWHGRPMATHEEATISLITSTAIADSGREIAAGAEAAGHQQDMKNGGVEMRDLPEEPIMPDQAGPGQLSRHNWHPEWNYDIIPANQR